ncbi:hypothetical protein PIROE2DRAFT_9848 [Piromyces sp. E2]|nr:hypothetical protein PIROE2DRAFT_9848 [Piromyces sp. E2]|eukprot:OUM63568.1 hypothetical protein PIROE2DRAFT_9848 [Piromyces sp. E2]
MFYDKHFTLSIPIENISKKRCLIEKKKEQPKIIDNLEFGTSRDKRYNNSS